MYHIDHIIREVKQTFDDAAHTAYVKGAYRRADALGLLMQDFFCHAPAKMHYTELAECADFFKHKKEEVNTMCKIMEKNRKSAVSHETALFADSMPLRLINAQLTINLITGPRPAFIGQHSAFLKLTLSGNKS